MPISEPILVPDRSSEEVRKQVLDGYMREPVFDPTLAKKVSVRSKGDPKQLTSLQPTRCWLAPDIRSGPVPASCPPPES